MPTFSEATPTITRKFAGQDITVPCVYAEGHALTAAEATGLNALIATRVGNTFGHAIREAVAKIGPKATVADLDWDFQAEFYETFESYELGQTRAAGTGPTTDPVEAMIRVLATADLKHRLKAKGANIKAVMAKGTDGAPSKFQELLTASIASGTDKAGNSWQALAEEAVARMSEADEGEDDLLEGLEAAA